MSDKGMLPPVNPDEALSGPQHKSRNDLQIHLGLLLAGAPALLAFVIVAGLLGAIFFH